LARLAHPARAFRDGQRRQHRRLDIAMTDFSAGLPYLICHRSSRCVLCDGHIRDARRREVGDAPNNAGYTSVDAAVAAAAHDVLVAEFGIFFGPNTPFESVYTAELAPSQPAAQNRGSPWRGAAAAMLASRANEDVLGALNAPYTRAPSPATTTHSTKLRLRCRLGALSTFGVRSRRSSARRAVLVAEPRVRNDVNEIAVLARPASQRAARSDCDLILLVTRMAHSLESDRRKILRRPVA